ncbi:small subunit ribosomal protein S6 [Desulfitispora alkaliphila]|uniref:30S ribosomal protein S6 n=1 Tax=Desulfitispora alkaliphila TaxID=622674 RepID=UPI003D1F90C3
MRQYELVYIINPEFDEEKRQALVEKVNDLVVRNGGELVKVDQWGKRKLAYPIMKFNEGVYVLVEYQAPAEAIAEVDRVLRITDGVIKHLITRQGE